MCRCYTFMGMAINGLRINRLGQKIHAGTGLSRGKALATITVKLISKTHLF